MAPARSKPASHVPGKNASSLKGTLVGVLFVGGVIAATWLSVFFLFLSRMQ
ncbi:cytochrome c oxidase subunit 2A [Staphylospora marina]|uniref:cytochrome c oxidase subunit 2A n=1 Tax=Staphylospora marina TaxID=2490858 RepID=UPI000F5BF90E|nr:cytochrome c oxidase subunit 2A [Staphylospora marina]